MTLETLQDSLLCTFDIWTFVELIFCWQIQFVHICLKSTLSGIHELVKALGDLQLDVMLSIFLLIQFCFLRNLLQRLTFQEFLGCFVSIDEVVLVCFCLINYLQIFALVGFQNDILVVQS
jgi:hypothetical protein